MAEAVAVGSATSATEVEVTSVRTQVSQTNKGALDELLIKTVLMTGNALFEAAKT